MVTKEQLLQIKSRINQNLSTQSIVSNDCLDKLIILDALIQLMDSLPYNQKESTQGRNLISPQEVFHNFDSSC